MTRSSDSLTPPPRGSKLISMLRQHTGLRITLALLVVLTMGIAAPLHAAHHHDDNRLHAPCAVCQLHSPACEPLLKTFAGVSLEPVFTLAFVSTTSLHSVSVATTGTRAPPFFLA